jgi:PAS domain S-box-containing protein
MVWSLGTLPAGAGGTRYRILSAIDRTPAFEAQSDLKSEREFVAALLWAVPALVVVTDGNGHVVHCNKAFSEATGLSMAQVRGRHVGEFTQMQELGGHAGRALAKPVPDREVRSHVAQLRHRDGAVREIAWNQSVIRDSAGAVRYAIASGVDVSAERTAVEELRTTHQRLRELGTDLERVREEERRRVARELHDGLGQTLGALRMDLEGMLRDVAGGQTVGAGGERAEPVRRLSGVLEGMDAAIEDVRRIAADLRPLLLDDLGLGAAVEWLAENFAQRVGLRCRATVAQACSDLCEPHATTLFRILQEALTNVSRHAQASSVRIRLYPSPDRSWVCLDVRDDGVGLREEARARSRSLGLLGIRERALALGGSATIDGMPRRGTTLTVRLPLPSACEDRA